MGFADSLKKICDETGDDIEDAVRATAFEMLSSVVKMSPVGNPDIWKGSAPAGYVGGRFRNNWQIGYETINTDTSRAPSENGSASLSEGKSALESWKAGQTIFISNSLPYAQRLEFGWSSQAPGGMVRLTAQRFNKILDANIRAITK